MTVNLFGPLITGTDVRKAMEATIRLWSRTYIAEMERRLGIEARGLPTFRSYETSAQFDHWPEDQLPGIITIAPGLLAPPTKEGGGMMTAEWAVGIGIVVAGQDRTGSMRLAEIYSTVVRALVLQHPSLGGFAEGVTWQDERYDDLNEEESRNMAVGTLQFGVMVRSVLNVDAGPVGAPPADPYTVAADWPTVEHVFVEVDRRI